MVKINTWCLRCPDEPSCAPGKKELLNCREKPHAASKLWKDFADNQSCNESTMLHNDELCLKLITEVTKYFQQGVAAANEGSNDVPHSLIVQQVAQNLSDSFGQEVTKQHLEYAYQKVKSATSKSSKSTKSKGKLPTSSTTNASTTASTSAPAAQSSDKTAWSVPKPQATVHNATSSIANLNLSNGADTAEAGSNTTATSVPSSSAAPSIAPTTSETPSPAIDDKTTHAQPPSVIGAPRPRKDANAATTSVFTNHFTIDLKPGIKLYEYQLVGLMNKGADLSRSKKKVMIKRKIESTEILRANQDKFACNDSGRIIAWKELYPNARLNDIVDNAPVVDYDRDQQNVVSRQINVDVVFKRVIELDDLQNFAKGNKQDYQETGAASALDILISRGIRGRPVSNGQDPIIQIGDNRFFTPWETHDFGRHGMIAIRGYSSSVQPVDGSLRLNVNTALSAFYKKQKVSNLIDFYHCESELLRLNFQHELQQKLVGLRVRIMYDRCKPGEDGGMDTEARRTKTITGFSTLNASQLNFTDRNNRLVSVYDHFMENYATAGNRSDPNQICVNTSSTVAGSECWFLPDQLQVVPGQIYSRTLDRLDPTFPGKMIDWSCSEPPENLKSIQDSGLAALGLKTGQPELQMLRAAGMRVQTKMLKVPCRVIPMPVIQYANTTKSLSNTSSWNTGGQKFLTQGGKLKSGVVHFLRQKVSKSEGPDEAKQRKIAHNIYMDGFMNSFQLNLTSKANVKKQYDPLFIDTGHGGILDLYGKLKSSQAGLFVLILPDTSKPSRGRHATFRIVADQMLGIPSIAMCEERIIGSASSDRPFNAQALTPYMANNAMKLNARLGNENHTVRAGFSKLLTQAGCDTLVLGADLIHPKAGCAAVTPTIAAVVGSVSKTFGKFTGSVRRQTAGEEIISSSNMVEMVTERIQAWQQLHGPDPPARILYYRDGTGASQYDGIRQEINDIKTAWNRMNKSSKVEVQVTAVVAVKRHNTRLYPAPGNPIGNKHNCVAGTVVDSHITSPYYFDFYLQSHQVMAGSAKPTHYFVLENGMNFTARELQDLTNNFCYVFSHSTSAVSYAAPAYFADKLCERAMLYLYQFNDNVPEISEMSEVLQQQQLKIAWERGQGKQSSRKNPWNSKMDDKMFWM
ncbi:unnamed protein product [Zymoseptoria tritici ST99CH_1A5]|uniref:Uncharacterized protein n=1 Tax=Zymoseptoria tritici ST99CH_1A5 TaxID=1276529 RepID=A0A1Y6LDL2_ZYMTR|nr:unnamed protein product [Zymoseptoria tritici ST99CH_1A5]